MITVDEHFVHAPAEVCFNVAADVERWPLILPHYRWVRFRSKKEFGAGIVEMSAWRQFPAGVKYPTWWVSEMRSDAHEPAVYYQHIAGVTRGMAVQWQMHQRTDGTLIRLVHEWSGPAWPLIGSFAANAVIGPHFVSAIAQRTLAGVAREAESRSDNGNWTDHSRRNW